MKGVQEVPSQAVENQLSNAREEGTGHKNWTSISLSSSPTSRALQRETPRLHFVRPSFELDVYKTSLRQIRKGVRGETYCSCSSSIAILIICAFPKVILSDVCLERLEIPPPMIGVLGGELGELVGVKGSKIYNMKL